MEDEQDLLLIIEKEAIKKKIQLYLAEQPEILFGYLFGSFLSSGSYHDINLAIYFQSEIGFSAQLNLTAKYSTILCSQIGLPVDVQSLNVVGLEVKLKVIQGELLISHNEEERFIFLEEF